MNCDSSRENNQFAINSRLKAMAIPTVSSSGYSVLTQISDVPEPYNGIFGEYEQFNAIQSTVFQDVFYSDCSIAVSAPTGSGKTVIFELAIVKLLMNFETAQPTDTYKIIYIAPMKALCEERLTDWHKKFNQFGVTCISVTGDSENIDIQSLLRYNLIITTPEKWDSMTRRWRDNEKLVGAIKLFLIDEIHLINDETRGATLEAIVTRMKTIRNSGRMEGSALRFIGVSATVSNVKDVAEWFETPTCPGRFHQFKDDMRPVHLQKVVLGYPYNPAMSSPFKFDMMLGYKLHHILLQHSHGKPTLVFCSTRKSVEMTSKQLIQNLTIALNDDQKKTLIDAANEINDSKLTETLIHGVGSHHAGMLPERRRSIENLFREGFLPVLVTTSTLAIGVNLPAHLVVIKSTKYYANGEYKNYDESMLFQMIGRAGRPQFDTSGTAVIMTTVADKHKYENMISGEFLIESHLRKHLVEFINAEVVLRTITDLSVAMEWLSATFLYIRAKKNPKYYGLSADLTLMQLDKKLLEMCQIEVNKLCRAGMLTMDTNVTILPTGTGCLMARYCITFETMKLFTQMTGHEILQQILGLLSKCHEFTEIRLRSTDKSFLNILNKCRNKETIRFPLNGRIRTLDMKINCIIQAVLGCLEITEASLLIEAQKIMRIGERLLACLTEYLKSRENCYQAMLNSIILLKCFRARIWENSQYVSRQLNGIGSTLSKALVIAGKNSFKSILEANPRDLERIVNHKAPFGNNLQDQVKLIPRYTMKTNVAEDGARATITVIVTLENASDFDQKMTINPLAFMHLIAGDEENLLLHKKYTHIEMAESVTIVEVIEVVSVGTEIKVLVNWISEDWVGFDARSKIVLFEDKNKERNETKKMPRIKSAGKLGKTLKKKILLQQPVDKYFKSAKTLKRKRSSETSLTSKIKEPSNIPSEKIKLETTEIDDEIVESTQLLKPEKETESDETGKKIFNNCIATYLKCLNKKVLTENMTAKINEISSEIDPNIRSKTENVLKLIENNQDYIKANNVTSADIQKHVEKAIKPLTKLKQENAMQRKNLSGSNRAVQFEASLPRTSFEGNETSSSLQEFSIEPKKKLSPERKNCENKTITWKSPLTETKHQTQSPKPIQELMRRKFHSMVKGKVPSYALSDKDWAFDVKKCEDVVSKSFIDMLFGLDEKKENQPEIDLNATISSNSSLPKSVKTTCAESLSSYTQMGCNIMADKIKSAIPKINDEVNEERKDKKEENKPKVDEEPEESKAIEEEEPPMTQHSWEKDFLSNDMEEFFTSEIGVQEDNEEENLKYKKFKELENTIIRNQEFPLEPDCNQRYRRSLQKPMKQTHFLFGNEERLSPSNCSGFMNLQESENTQATIQNEISLANNYGLHKNGRGDDFDLHNFGVYDLKETSHPRIDDNFSLIKSDFDVPSPQYTRNPMLNSNKHYSNIQRPSLENRYQSLKMGYEYQRVPSVERRRDLIPHTSGRNYAYYSQQYEPFNQVTPHSMEYFQNTIPVGNPYSHTRNFQPQHKRYQELYRPYRMTHPTSQRIDYVQNSPYLGNRKYEDTFSEPGCSYAIPKSTLKRPLPHYNYYPGYRQQSLPPNYQFIHTREMSRHPRQTQKPMISPFETTFANNDDLDFILSFDGNHQEKSQGNESRYSLTKPSGQANVQYNRDRKSYLMGKYLRPSSEQPLNFSHTLTSNEFETNEEMNYKNY